jgi:hypothetical protein
LDIKLMFVPGVEQVGEQHHGRALTSEPLRRKVTSPGLKKLHLPGAKSYSPGEE